jgi:hypothetical protein
VAHLHTETFWTLSRSHPRRQAHFPSVNGDLGARAASAQEIHFVRLGIVHQNFGGPCLDSNLHSTHAIFWKQSSSVVMVSVEFS